VLFVKIVDFVPLRKTNETICQVILGCETKRGIIDIYMYLLSKFDKRRYDAMKNRENSVDTDLMVKSTSTSYLCLPTPNRQNQQHLHCLDQTQQDAHDEDYEEDEEDNLDDYVEEKEHESVDLCDTELIDNVYEPDHTDSDINQYENDDTQDVTQDNAMFTDILNSCCIEKNNLLYDLDNTIIYKSNDDDEEDTGLDLYPVKEDDNKIRGNNYSEMLYFESINLQPVAQKYQIPSETKTPTTTLQLKDIGCSSTAVAQRTKYLPRQNTNLYNLTMPFPPSNPLKTAQYNQIKLAANANLENNSFSDTDSSIAQKGGPCCFKWTPNGKNLQKFKQKLNPTIQKISHTSTDLAKMRNDEIENDLLARLTSSGNNNNNNSSSSSNRKVKFQVK